MDGDTRECRILEYLRNKANKGEDNEEECHDSHGLKPGFPFLEYPSPSPGYSPHTIPAIGLPYSVPTSLIPFTLHLHSMWLSFPLYPDSFQASEGYHHLWIHWVLVPNNPTPKAGYCCSIPQPLSAPAVPISLGLLSVDKTSTVPTPLG